MAKQSATLRSLPGQYVLGSKSYFLSMAGLPVADSGFCTEKVAALLIAMPLLPSEGEKFRFARSLFRSA